MKKQKKAFSFSSLLPKHPDDAPLVPFPGFLARVSPERRGRAPPPSSSSDPPTSLPPQVELAAVAAGREPGALRGEPHAVDAAGVPGAAASARGAGVADRGGALGGPTEAPELGVCFLLLSISTCKRHARCARLFPRGRFRVWVRGGGLRHSC